jgi:alpha-glucosidase (family GH31 glycosyl hydrolase)
MAVGMAAASVPAVAPLAVPPARAAVSIGTGRIVISGPGVRATITRDPFRLQVGPAAGAAALSEVATGTRGPTVLPPTTDPVPPGTNAPASGQLYAPLAFLVGRETITQYDGGVWGGNLQSGERSGIQYAARAVTRVQRVGSGVRLTLSTTDPTGRVLRVDVAPDGAGAVRVTATPVPSAGVAMMSDAFASTPSEAFHGFGGLHNALDQHGQVIASFVAEENIVGVAVPNPLAAELYPNGPTAAYYPQAQFVSSRGYGFLSTRPELTRFRLDSDRPNAWSVAVSARGLQYVVTVGTPSRAMAEQTALSGRQPAPPAWALGPMLDRLVLNRGAAEAVYEAALKSDIANIDRYHLPVTAYRIEGWGFPTPGNDGFALHTFVRPSVQAQTIAALKARGIHPLAYLRPWIEPGSAPDRDGLTIRHADGSTYLTTGTLGQKIALLDFTNPAAVRFWQHELAKMFDLGFDGLMQDFGEEVLYDMHFADGATGVTMHNRYLVLYMRATREEITAYEHAHPGRTLWFFNRAGFSGTPGSAAYEGGNFPGDEATDFSQAAGLASSTPDMLNRAIGGAFGFGTDIGGYYDYTTPPTTKGLFLRWAEWAALSPVFRLHGSARAGTHTPWSYDRQTVRVYRSLSLLHVRAAPLILRLWRQGDRTGVPPTRPLWLQYPGDPRAAAQTQEWVLGPDVLVAPVVAAGATSRTVYFPAGCWRDPQTRLVVHGPRTASVPAPLTVLPYFFRCGTDPFRTPRRPAPRPPTSGLG